MTHKLRGVRVDEFAYYVNKLRQNVGLETWIWRQFVTSGLAKGGRSAPGGTFMGAALWGYAV